ncbi:hypothetical protein [Pseudomonas kermanshahensis]|uniref:hypothetical protein n=1 Tax=Pseudomonas kermanshahensis TaxID=2745482 RepID=UPI003D099A83
MLLKITAQYRTDQTFENGDVLSLVVNVAGIVGGITLLAGAGSVAGVFTAVGVGANALGMLNSDVANNLYQRWDPDSQSVALGSEPLHQYEIVGGGGGGYIEGISGGGGPLIFPLPESPGWSVDIGPIQIIEPGGNSFGVDRYH